MMAMEAALVAASEETRRTMTGEEDATCGWMKWRETQTRPRPISRLWNFGNRSRDFVFGN